MLNNEVLAPINHVHILWEKLTQELSGILDAHGVCSAVAQEVAVFTGVQTVVGIRDSVRDYFDVWVCEPDGQVKQRRWNADEASFDSLIEQGKTLRQPKYDLPAKEVINSELWILAKDEMLFAPLPYPAGYNTTMPHGAICLLDPPAGCILNLSNLGSLATHITTFLDRAFLRHRSDRQEVEFAIVYDLTASLTTTLNMESIFSQITDPVRRALNVETVSIGLIEQVTGDIVFVDILMGPMFQGLPTVRLKAGQGIAGWVATKGEPVIVNNAYHDNRFFAKVDSSSGFRTDSMLAVPLKVENKVIGVLEAINKRIGDFTDYDLRLLQAISGPLAASIENARLHADVLAEKRRVETIFASMSEGMLTVNREGRITAANDSLLALLHLEIDDLLGKPATNSIKIVDENGFGAFMEQVLNAHDDYPSIASDIRQSSGERVSVLISGAPIDDEEGQISETIYVFSDLSQVREVERMRDDFFHNIIHELRTPLATILMYARLLREGKARNDPAKADRFLGVIERESDRLQRMVRQMLQVAKLNAREIQRSSEPVYLNTVFDEMLPPLAETAVQKGLAFSQRVAKDLPPVMGNHETLYMIFKNLVENAIKFTMSGTVRIRARLEGNIIRVEVSDDGIGIPDTALPNLFKRFYRTKTAVERGIAGTGLGLYMVKEGVEKHKGTLNVSSAEGEGTTFLVQLPIAEEV